ncbi:Ketose-bisphosphate aldolase, class-II [Akanthomyces lecanii RCEF 1005]|uniref:Fructose-bisphosphate aldolase n=1 Tax=Akanthomyces lecanii RCEF 1005 TaxID=1081108 RepID=A0A168AU53_CORDF|nr:Ketose-bisphosphate aldolase, class-II [Akanthomyces lecanii RCEF 1005]
MANSNGGSSRTNLILKAAEDGRYGVIAAIAYNIEQLYGLVKAAEKARSPLILQFFPWAVTYADGLLVRSAAIARDAASVPISIHLDHAQDPAIVKLAADTLPFDSIMVDMSHYEKEENLAKTAALVKYCQDRGIATEAEPGRIEGAEDGVMDTAELEACLTTPEEVEEFVGTGVDTLAPAFKNIHGEYGPEGPQLDFERLASVRSQIGGRVRIALHGTNGFPKDILQKCIALGVSKVNVNRLVLDDYYEYLHHDSTRKLPHTRIIEESTDKVVKLTMKWMEICGSAGKA